MATDLSVTLSQKQIQNFVQYIEAIMEAEGTYRSDFRAKMEEVDRAYARENISDDETQQARLAKLKGDVKKIRNVEVPIVKPQIESFTTYMVSVFLTGNPIFGVTAGPKHIDAAQQWNTLLMDHAQNGQWVTNLTMFFRDGAKYNLHGLHTYWDSIQTYAPETSPTEAKAKRRETIWSGNRIDRLDMYNTFFDRRIAPREVHAHGEYAGFHKLISRIEFKVLLDKLQPTFNVVNAFNSSFTDNLYYEPQINRAMFDSKAAAGKGTNWDNWFAGFNSKSQGSKISYSGAYVLTTLYCRIIPIDFELYSVRGKNQPQIWKLLIINGKYPIYAQRLTNLHDFLPIIIGQPFDDGLGLQTKSLADDVLPFQDVSSALWNSRLHAARRRISDRIIYDSHVIEKSEIEKPDASAKIAARLPSYNADIRRHALHLPFEDTASASFSQEVGALTEMSFYASGQNRVQQGQFQKGNKTLQEFDTTMGKSEGRNQTAAIFIEDQIFTPVKHILKLNILQNQQEAEIYNRVEDKIVKIDPKVIRETATAFKMTDGLTPASKQMSTDDFGAALQFMAQAPVIGNDYRIGDVFAYLFKLRGVEELETFKLSPAERMFKQQQDNWYRVAELAIKAGQQPPPQPEPPEELKQQMNQQQAAKQ